jgi:putative aldouronate transport system permease protein
LSTIDSAISQNGAASYNAKRRTARWDSGELKKHGAYLLMLLPGTVFLFIFSYLPLPAILMAFKNYKLAIPPKDFWLQNRFFYSLFYKSPWMGLNNFAFIFSSNDFAIFMRNTLGYNLIFMIIGPIVAVSIAVGINELRQRFAAKAYHTILFMPFFLSWIIVTYVVYAFISSNGLFNQVLRSFGADTVNIYSNIKAWPIIFVIANIWRYAGNNSIIYLATLTGFSQELYEASMIDGAGKWKQFVYITLPQLIPTIVLLQILAVGRILNTDFDMFWNLVNGSGIVHQARLTIDVYVYAAIRGSTNLGLPAAAALFQSIIGFSLVLLTNAIVRKVDRNMAMF